MIKSLSPYNLSIPFVAPLSGLTCSSYTLQIFVWNGLKNVVPTNTTYEITKYNPTGSTGNDSINISLLINDFIDFTPYDTTATELIDGNNQYWVKTQILYTTADEDDFVPNYEETLLMTSGYGYGMDGENSQIPSNNILLTGAEFKVSRDGFFILPILIEETTDESTLVLDSVTLDTGSIYDYAFTSSFSFTQLYSQIRQTPESAWSTAIIFSGTTSPQSRTVTVSEFQTRIYAFNVLTGNNIYSNIVSVS